MDDIWIFALAFTFMVIFGGCHRYLGEEYIIDKVESKKIFKVKDSTYKCELIQQLKYED